MTVHTTQVARHALVTVRAPWQTLRHGREEVVCMAPGGIKKAGLWSNQQIAILLVLFAKTLMPFGRAQTIHSLIDPHTLYLKAL